jgi:hypothetical protein
MRECSLIVQIHHQMASLLLDIESNAWMRALWRSGEGLRFAGLQGDDKAIQPESAP